MMDLNPSIPPRPRPRPAGFTLTELLIVIGVIVLLFTIALPAFRTMMTTGNADSAFTAVSAATATIRAYSGDPQSFTLGDYQGTALLFTPANEIRFLRNDENITNTSGSFIIQKTPSEGGYVDIPGQNSIQLPDDAGVVGFTLGGASATVLMYTPPFAVRFNPQGELIARSATTGGSNPSDGNVYYDGNYNGKIADTVGRSSSYDPNPYDPTATTWNTANFNTTYGKYVLPFEQIDTVVGVILYSKAEFRGASSTTITLTASSSNLNSTTQTWLLQHGKVYFFNRYTGGLINR